MKLSGVYPVNEGEGIGIRIFNPALQPAWLRGLKIVCDTGVGTFYPSSSDFCLLLDYRWLKVDSRLYIMLELMRDNLYKALRITII